MENYEFPALDFDTIAALPEDERTAALAAYEAAVRAYAEDAGQAAKEEELRRARYEAAKYKMAVDETYAGFGSRMEAIERILAQTPALGALPDEEKLRMAYYIDRGMQEKEEPTAAQLLEAVRRSPEVLRAIEASLAASIEGEGAPALFASAGSFSMPATVREKPKTIGEASALAREALGLKS